MIVNKQGNLLNAKDCEVIAHQCNCFGLMGAGIAKQIKKRWNNEVFVPYRDACNKNQDLLGKIQVLRIKDDSIRYVINLFAQYGVGHYNAPYPNGRQTDYDALQTCLFKVKQWCKDNGVKSIGIPKYLGCGLAGGDWDGVVYPMICEIFKNDEEILLNIYEFTNNIPRKPTSSDVI